ncbi:sulfurtransferase TusA family protein [Sphingomonas sp. VDB2]|uniref:sulfurtransferase TusA family protein n=1 Tax=Sphingomonas sp. VDB2 TaxID=3228751 RepID=UPI003A80D44C
MAADPVPVNARGMKCPWPALRAARAMRDAGAIVIEADDPIAASELEALAQAQGWIFAALGEHRFTLSRTE